MLLRARIVLILLLLAVTAGAAYVAVAARRLRAEAQAVHETLRDELQTVTLVNCDLERFGSEHDGGYLLCGNLLAEIASAYSYGINTEDNWGCEISRRFAVPVHQYDCFTPHRPTCDGGAFVFHDECVGPVRTTRDGQPYETVAAQIVANGDAGKRLLVKMDVEGAEWESLRATPDDVLASMDQIAMELHWADARGVDVIRRLKQSFHLVNLNFNNWACSPDAAPLPAPVYQVLWVNKRIGVLDPNGPSPARRSAENAPDNPNAPDCQLTP